MADVHTPEQRSYNMSRIHSKNTKPEELGRKFLFSQGFRYRKMMPGCQENQTLCYPNIKRSSL